LLCCNFFIKNSFRNIKKQIFQDDKTTKNNEKSKKRKIVFFIFLIYVFLEFFSVNFPYKPIDLYHEGQLLTPAYNNIINGGYWSKSYLTIGVFYELFSTSFTWKLLGLETIGAARFKVLLLTLIFKISLLFLSYQITKKFILEENKKILSNSKLNLSTLQKSQLVNKKYSKLKLLGSGDIKEKFDIETNFISNSAKEKIEKLGGKVTLIK